MDRVDLRPCPFCGGKAQGHSRVQDYAHFVTCCGCGVERRGSAYKPEMAEILAADIWNRRPAEDALQAEVEALRYSNGTNATCAATFKIELDQALARATRAEAEAAELRKDAERLDWLQRVSRTTTVYMNNQHPWNFAANHKLRDLRGPTLRAAIDAALKGQREGES